MAKNVPRLHESLSVNFYHGDYIIRFHSRQWNNGINVLNENNISSPQTVFVTRLIMA